MARDSAGFKVVSFLLCEDVRREMNGKETLIGVYSRDIIVKEFPVRLAQLVIRIVLEIEKNFDEFKLSIIQPNKQKLLEMSGTGEPPNLDDWVHFPFKFSMAEFPDAGLYVVRIALDGRWRKAGQFNVRLPKNDAERARLGITN